MEDFWYLYCGGHDEYDERNASNNINKFIEYSE